MARVLVVEDEPNISSIIMFKLRREGHEVLLLEDAPGAADAARRHRADLVLLDSTLPGGDAFEILEELASRTRTVMMTEFRDQATPARALAAGAAATIQKPFKPTVLAHLVARLSGAEGEPPGQGA